MYLGGSARNLCETHAWQPTDGNRAGQVALAPCVRAATSQPAEEAKATTGCVRVAGPDGGYAGVCVDSYGNGAFASGLQLKLRLLWAADPILPRTKLRPDTHHVVGTGSLVAKGAVVAVAWCTLEVAWR